MGLIESPLGVCGIEQDSFKSAWDLTEFLQEWVGLDQIPLSVAGTKYIRVHTSCTHVHLFKTGTCVKERRITWVSCMS